MVPKGFNFEMKGVAILLFVAERYQIGSSEL